jgi:cytidylate kinase
MIVTISASYGAGGSELGPRVAQRLGVRFVDRAIPVAVAQELGISVEEAEAVQQNSSSRLWQAFARLSPLGGMAIPPAAGQAASDRELLEVTQAQLCKVADDGDAVILGHAAAVVLADREAAVHIRLDGSPAGRIRSAMHQHGIDADEAASQQKDNDRIRSGYVQHFYRADSADPCHYHLVLDTVRLGWDKAEELIVRAAQDTPTG